jgi:hypothetical protein
LLEVTMAVVLLLAAMTLAMKLVVGVALEQRGADRRMWALQTASNLAERIAAEPFAKLTTERARALAATASADRVLPGAEWTVDVADAGGPAPPGKRVTLRLRWKDRSGEWTAPVHLTSWVFRGRDRS